MDLLSAVVIILIVSAVTGTRKWVLRMWHRKKFCESNRALCRALVTAGFPDFKEYLYFKEDFSDSDKHQSWYEHGCINFYGSELSNQEKEKILNVVEEYCHCEPDYDYDHKATAGIPICPENYPLISQKVESTKYIRRIYLKGKKR
jgi:hypothetical protein